MILLLRTSINCFLWQWVILEEQYYLQLHEIREDFHNTYVAMLGDIMIVSLQTSQ